MKHRERVQMALNHEEPDRCPMQVSFTPEFANRLQADLAMNQAVLNLSRSGNNPHGGGNTYELERALGVDMLLTSVGWANSYYQDGEVYTDEWGVTWRSVPYDTPYGTGSYTEIAGHPLAEDGAIGRYHAPDPTRPGLVRRRSPDAGRFPRRVLDRRRDRDDDLGDGLGAARQRPVDDRSGHQP